MTRWKEYWAWWSRHIFYNRYVDAPLPVYQELLALVKDKDYFVLTTNVDHQFQRAGFDKKRLFYTQGDYGLWQCSRACHNKTYDNEDTVRQMIDQQQDMEIPSELIPRCRYVVAPMIMNLRCDDTFVQVRGWYAARNQYSDFVRRHKHGTVLYLELGVGNNTPVIIKYPFWKYTLENPDAVYACVNFGQGLCAKGNRRAFRLSGRGHWTYPVSTETKGNFIKNGQSLYHERWGAVHFFLFKAWYALH